MKKLDVILIGAVILLAAVFFVVYWSSSAGKTVVLYSDRMEIGRYPLNEACVIPIMLEGTDKSRETELKEDSSGDDLTEYNLLVIEDGCAYIREANCYNQICVHTPPISRKGETIVCMPHKFYIIIE